MTICKVYGYPDLFITFTCNLNWPEIARFVNERGLKSEDRSDAITRVFKQKLDSLMRDFKDGHYFGKLEACIKLIYLFSQRCSSLLPNPICLLIDGILLIQRFTRSNSRKEASHTHTFYYFSKKMLN